MSIQSQINRIKTEKESLITNLKEIGIEIEDGATLGNISLNIEETENILDTSDATATADEIFNGETAYVNGEKVTGSFTIDSEITTQENLISQISTLVQTKAIPQGSTDTSDATATSSDILSGKTAYVKGTKITGNIASQSGETIIPTTTEQIAVSSGKYVTGNITISGDSNLIAENIKNGVSIFGVTGNYTANEENSGSGSGNSIINITVLNNSMNPVYYWNNDGVLCEVTAFSNQSINALNGVVCYTQETLTSINGVPNSYFSIVLRGVYIAVFLQNGGQMTCYGESSGGAGN